MNELTLVHVLRKNVGFGIKGMYLGLFRSAVIFFLKMNSWFLEGLFPSQSSDQHPCGWGLPSFSLLQISSRGISPAGSSPLETGIPFQDTSVHCALCSREPQLVAASLQSVLAKSKAAL